MPEEMLWKLEPHTKAKHEILKHYLAAWFPIMALGGHDRRVIYLDAFAGPGRYKGGEPGSPIIALETLVNHDSFRKFKDTKFQMIFVESDAARVSNLNAEIDDFWKNYANGKPVNVEVFVEHATFSGTADRLLDELEKRGLRLAPTFAFIDPFGFADVPLATLARLMKNPKCEVLVNFMYNRINQFVTHPGDAIQQRYQDLFGCDDYQDADGLDPADRKAFIHNLYETQLKISAGCNFVRRFEMIGQKGKTIYSLIFGTSNIKGLSTMKNVMWRIDRASGFKFSDRLAGLDVLFQPEPDFSLLRDYILSTFSGQTVIVNEVERYVIEETPFTASHYKRQILKPLEDCGFLHVDRTQTQNGTYPDGTILHFGQQSP